MSTGKRIRKNTHRGMHKRMIRGKKPMTTELKEAQKKMREADREATKADLAKKSE